MDIVLNGTTAFSAVDIATDIITHDNNIIGGPFTLSATENNFFWVAGNFTSLHADGATLTLRCYVDAKTDQEFMADLSALTIDSTALDSKQNVEFSFPRPIFLRTGVPLVVKAHSTNANDTSISGNVYLINPYGATYSPAQRRTLATGGAAGSVTLDTSASATNDIYNGMIVAIVSGTGAGQARLITDYDGSTKVATVVPNWTTNPVSGSVFMLLTHGGVDVRLLEGTAINMSGDGYQEVDAVKVNGGTPMTAADVNTQVDNALDTAIPASPTANSINERLDATGGGGF